MALLLACLASSIGCALVPGVPAGPLRGPGVRAGLTCGRASVSTRQASGEPHTLRGNSAMFRGLVPLLPTRAMLRASPAPFMDVGADWGWTDAALQLRAGRSTSAAAGPGASLEGRTARFRPFREGVRQTTSPDV